MNNKTETKTALEPDSLSAGINKTKKFIMASATDMNEYAEQEKAKAAAILKQKVAIIAWVINEVNRLELKLTKNGNYGLMEDIKDYYKAFYSIGKNESDYEKTVNCLEVYFTRFYKYYEGKKGCGKFNKVWAEYCGLF